MQKSPTECRTVGRTGRECVECWVTKMNVKILGEAYRTLVRPALDERGRDIEEDKGKEIGGRRNTNAMMDVRRYKARQDKE